VWQVVMKETTASNVESAPTLSQEKGIIRSLSATNRRKAPLVLAGLLLLVGMVVAVQHLAVRPHTPSAIIPPEQASALPLPDKSSIVVLPFVNMSGDPAQEYFSDGITDDLTTDLSRLSGLFVISRNSAFTYKGKAVKVEEVSRELGVRYVLEGSVRRVESR